jgi:hypothetical protein
MAGVNLSQSTALAREHQSQRRFAVSGFLISTIVLAVTLIGWGGLRWYIHSLDQKIATLEVTIATDTGRLTGETVDRIADFSVRMGLLGKDPAELVDPEATFAKLETLIVPQVTLVRYEYDESAGTSSVSGTTESFRYLAEQIISLQSDPLFGQIRVDSIDRDDDGAIEFTLINNL